MCRPNAHCFLTLFTLLASSVTVDAQTAAPGTAPYYANAVTDGAGSLAPGPSLVPLPPDMPWSMDLLIGFPTGVRVQRSLGDSDWLLEGFAGLDIIVFPMAGGGIRRRLTPFRATHDSLELSPGFGAYVLYNTFHNGGLWIYGNPSTFELLAADLDILWKHDFSDRCGGQFGFRLGAAANLSSYGGVL